MRCKKILIIPDRAELSSYTKFADRLNLGFEYNDFFIPKLLDDTEQLDTVIAGYEQTIAMPGYCTLHGAFLDVTVFSDDSMIARASDYRVEQSLTIAKRLGAKGVVFHTNYIANFKTDSYRDSFVKKNAAYWSEKLLKYPDIQIYMENMFDDTPELLAGLAEELKGYKNFGVCFDYAHAHVFGNPDEIGLWVQTLAPYVKHLHINDNDFRQDLHLAVGDGKIDWKLFKNYFENYFPEATVLIEVSGMEKIRKSLDFLESL